MPRSIDLQHLKRLLDEGAQLVEVLPAVEYDEEHLPGAINIPLKTRPAPSSFTASSRWSCTATTASETSAREPWRLETLGFEQVHDYVGGKADWLANGLRREGDRATVPYAGELVDRDPPTCALSSTLPATDSASCSTSASLGRVRRSALDAADALASVESVMEPGPSTVRVSTPADELVQRLAAKDLATAIVTTPGGCLVGVFDRADAQARLSHPGIP